MASPVGLVVIVGRQASVKSTIASALNAGLRRQGERVTVVELDQIAAMAQPTSAAEWDGAARVFESVVGQWARLGMSCVIAEGSGSRDEAERLRQQAPPAAVTVTVATTAPFEVALARAQGDPTRGSEGTRLPQRRLPSVASTAQPDLPRPAPGHRSADSRGERRAHSSGDSSRSSLGAPRLSPVASADGRRGAADRRQRLRMGHASRWDDLEAVDRLLTSGRGIRRRFAAPASTCRSTSGRTSRTGRYSSSSRVSSA